MKNLALISVYITTAFLVVFTIYSQLDVYLKVMNILFIIGNLLVILIVYTVLKDKYSTSKTFKDWYEDCPKKNI